MTEPPTDDSRHDVTGLLLAWRAGDRDAFEALIPLVYEELRHIAHRQLAGERQQTLQTIDLVHEAYVRLVDASRVRWQNRAHFLAVAARSMRRILVDAARTRGAQKRGGDLSRVELEPDLVAALAPDVDVIALDEALSELAEADARRGNVVELRYFGGLTVEETAQVLDVAPETVMRDWKVARAWLHQRLTSRPPAGG
jgi:RNA polymerase sigma factor (TIGR02999 family)